MLGGGATGDQEVVQVDKDEGKGAEDRVHEALECLGTILQPKWHPQKFESTKWSDDSSLPNVVRVHGDLVVRFCQEKMVQPFNLAVKSLINGSW